MKDVIPDRSVVIAATDVNASTKYCVAIVVKDREKFECECQSRWGDLARQLHRIAGEDITGQKRS